MSYRFTQHYQNAVQAGFSNPVLDSLYCSGLEFISSGESSTLAEEAAREHAEKDCRIVPLNRQKDCYGLFVKERARNNA